MGEGCKYFDLDNGYSSIRNLNDPLRAERMKIDVELFTEDHPLRPVRWVKMKSKLLEIVNSFEGGKRPWKSFVWDSLTTAGEWAMQNTLYNNQKFNSDGTIKSKTGGYEIQDWGLAMAELERCLGWVRGLPIPVIVVAHEDRKELVVDGKVQDTKIEMSVIGSKLAPKIPVFFDEVWRIKPETISGKTTYKIQTKPNSLVLARSRYNLPDGIDSNQGMRKILESGGFKME